MNTSHVLSLLPFVAWFYYAGSVVALIVIWNGVLVDSYFSDSRFVVAYDVAWKCALTARANLCKGNPLVCFFTLIGCVMYLVDRVNRDVTPPSSRRIHRVVGVEWPIFAALWISERVSMESI